MIKGFIPVSFVDWPGKICSVVFVGGCNFRCPWCHNKDLACCPNNFPDIQISAWPRLHWLDGVTITGGEILETVEKTDWLLNSTFFPRPLKIDTNGYTPNQLKRVLHHKKIHAVYMDIKAPLSDKRYSQACGVPVDAERIKHSIELLKLWRGEVVFRTTQHPGISDDDILRIKEYLGPDAKHIVQEYRPPRIVEE